MNEVDYFRRIGRLVEDRLRQDGIETRAHVGHDEQDAWRERLPDLPPDASLSWVAFEFPGLSVWDVHVGVLADFAHDPPRSTVGLHVLEERWAPALALLARDDPATARLLEADATRAEAIHEVQLNDPWGNLDVGSPEAEAERLAARAAELYALVRRRVLELAAELAKR